MLTVEIEPKRPVMVDEAAGSTMLTITGDDYSVTVVLSAKKARKLRDALTSALGEQIVTTMPPLGNPRPSWCECAADR